MSKYHVALAVLLAVTTYAAPDVEWANPHDVVLKAKHRLGSIKADALSGDSASAAGKIDDLVEMLEQWKDRLTQDQKATSSSDEDAERESTETFAIKVNHVPKKCSKRTSPGDKLKVHYIAKLLPEMKIVDSSFHTGSMPFRFTLGGADALVPGWNDGLDDMCKGERRDLTVPASQAFGPEGDAKRKIPGNADLLFHIELVEFSKGRSSSRPRKDL
jgi:FKBP-type peptidyl-prolyl cis-trans isomerase